MPESDQGIPELRSKWRPKLWMVVFGVLMLVTLLPLAGIVLVIVLERVLDTQFHLRSMTGLFVLAAGSMIMAAVIGAVFLRTLLRPIQELSQRTAEIETGEVEAFRPISRGGTQEVATLGERYFRMARKLSDRSNYLSLFSTHLSHELKTPLTSIQGAAELLQDDTMKPKQRERFLNNIIDDADRLAELSSRLRELAHADVADIGGQCDARAVFQACVEEAGLKLDWKTEDTNTIAMSKTNAQIVFKQFAENAAQHDAKIVTVRSERQETRLILEIGDDGAPISKANLPQLFDPFFTTRRKQGGTGMGLGIARTMLRNHGGEVGTSEREGYKFQIACLVN